MTDDLTPAQYLKLLECIRSNPGANAAWVALTLGVPREHVEKAMEMARK